MSEIDKIREMVMALARGDHAEANQAATAVMSAKTKRIAEAAINDSEEDSEEGEAVTEDKELEEGDRYMRAGRRHNRAGRRDVRRHRDMVTDANRPRDMDDEEYRMHMRKQRRADPSMRRRRPRRSQMHEMNDTGSDSGVVKGKHDDSSEDNTERKGSVKDSGVAKGKHDTVKDEV